MAIFRRNRDAVRIPDDGPFADVPPNGTLAPDDPALAPIAGIDLRRYATLSRALDGLDPDTAGAVVLADHGVTREAWAEAAAAWPRRITDNRSLAVLFSQVANAVGA